MKFGKINNIKIRFTCLITVLVAAVWPVLSVLSASATTQSTIQDIVGNVTQADGFRYGSRDNLGNTMDGAKIIANPSGGYLAVYHVITSNPAGNTVKLATSTDLLNWTFKVNLDVEASHGTISALPGGDFLTAVEYNNLQGSGGTLRLRYYPSLSALYGAAFTREVTLARTLSACNEGTPNIYSATLSPDIDNSVIDIGFHYHKNCSVDRQARGTLTNFTTWNDTTEAALDQTLKNATYVVGQSVGGNIGDRDQISYAGQLYNLHEIQYVKNDFGSWRTYLYNWQTNLAEYLPITTHGGSTAFANPTATNITSPAGNPAVVMTMFIPAEGAAAGEGGELIYYRELPTSGSLPGLKATYFDNSNLTGALYGRTDAQVNFNWGSGSPATGITADTFSVRWMGKVTPAYSQAYTFYTQTDDGVRLWVNGVQLINGWQDSFLGWVSEKQGTINLVAGQQYDIKMEYYDKTGNASAKLLWSSPSVTKQLIPSQALTTAL